MIVLNLKILEQLIVHFSPSSQYSLLNESFSQVALLVILMFTGSSINELYSSLSLGLPLLILSLGFYDGVEIISYSGYLIYSNG